MCTAIDDSKWVFCPQFLESFLATPLLALEKDESKIRRHHLMKTVILQGDDQDSDTLAAEGKAVALSDLDGTLILGKSQWQFQIIRAMEIYGVQLDKLTITIDQDQYLIHFHLFMERSLRQLSCNKCFDELCSVSAPFLCLTQHQ